MTEDLHFDAWTPLSFKRVLDRPATTRNAPPSWVGDHARRLRAYMILRSYVDNAAREFLETEDDKRQRAHREYGDPSLLVETATAAVLGESSEVITEGVENEQEAGTGPATEVQEWLRAWATRERFSMKLIEAERTAASLGDAVYSLGWSPGKGRPRLRVWDPGFYFPVLDDGNEDDFPRKVHIAWEYDNPEDPAKRFVRRITWELGPIADDGKRRYAWNDEPSTETCYLTDATWEIDPYGPAKLDDFDPNRADYAEDEDGLVRMRDLQIDFIPVVHLPNTISIIEGWGRSVIAMVLQILDDIANADTDLQAASATTGTPPVTLSGARIDGAAEYRPGKVWQLGENGRMDVLDTSKSLDALMGYLSSLLQRLSVNSRFPSAVLGRVEPSEVPSGIALLLSFGPFVSMIGQMRLVRAEKYELLLKFAHRLALAGGDQEAPRTWITSGLEFGSFLPEDRAAAVREVTALLQANAISTETAVQILIAVGFDIEDAQEEVKRIDSRDFEGAGQLLDATGSEAAVFEYLDREMEPRPAPPPNIIDEGVQ